MRSGVEFSKGIVQQNDVLQRQSEVELCEGKVRHSSERHSVALQRRGKARCGSGMAERCKVLRWLGEVL